MTTPSDEDRYDPETLRKEKLKDEISYASNEIEQIGKSDLAKLQEFIFVEVFLPFFAGDENPKYPVTLNHWINTSRSPYKGVNVIDDKGKVLFTTPPVFDRGAVNPVSNEGIPIAHVVESAHQYSKVSPRDGTRYLSAELTKRALVMKVPTNVLAHVEKWNEIFKRYGRPAIVELDETQSGDTPGVTSTDSKPQYDEFEPL